MNTYRTYQEAKIANPECEIVRWNKSDEYKAVSKSELSGYLTTWCHCNPADHCMAVKQFLDAGNKGVNGDLYLNKLGELQEIGVNCGENWFNEPNPHDDKRYVIKAKALEETKTYRYEKVTDTGFFDLKNEFQGRMIFFNQSVTSTPDYVVAMDIIELSHHYMQKNLYRRIEVTEKELAVDAAIEIICRGSHDGEAAYKREWFERLFDEGVLVRVNGKG